MFAPPPEGSFDLDDACLPIKSHSTDGSPEQVPLLTHDEAVEAQTDSDSDASKKLKVRFVD